MIEIFGTKAEGKVVEQLLEVVLQQAEGINGVFYRGFPAILSLEGRVRLDGVLCSREHGVTIFHCIDDKTVDEDLEDFIDDVHLRVRAKLSEMKQLNENRMLIVPITSIAFAPNIPETQFTEFDDTVALSRNTDQVIDNLKKLNFEYPERLDSILSRLQSLTNLRPKKNVPM